MHSRQGFRGMGKTDGDRHDAEYVAVLRDIEPAGTAEFAEEFDVRQNRVRRRLRRIEEGGSPVESKKIGGSLVWFVDGSKLDADAATAVEEVRERLEIEGAESP